MTKTEFYLLLDDLLENDPSTIKGDESLVTLQGWDSLAIIGFIALLDEHFSISVPSAKISECNTTADLAELLGDKLTD